MPTSRTPLNEAIDQLRRHGWRVDTDTRISVTGWGYRRTGTDALGDKLTVRSLVTRIRNVSTNQLSRACKRIAAP